MKPIYILTLGTTLLASTLAQAQTASDCHLIWQRSTSKPSTVIANQPTPPTTTNSSNQVTTSHLLPGIRILGNTSGMQNIPFQSEGDCNNLVLEVR